MCPWEQTGADTTAGHAVGATARKVEPRVPFAVTAEQDAVKGPVELAVRVADSSTGQEKPLALWVLGPQPPRS